MKLIKIGRSKECDIVFENYTNISRLHAEIFQDDEGNIFLTDLNSSNGTFVNGKRINSQKLKLPSGKILKGEERKIFETKKIKLDVLKSEKIIGIN